jgi:hypothetical protein
VLLSFIVREAIALPPGVFFFHADVTAEDFQRPDVPIDFLAFLPADGADWETEVSLPITHEKPPLTSAGYSDMLRSG